MQVVSLENRTGKLPCKGVHARCFYVELLAILAHLGHGRFPLSHNLLDSCDSHAFGSGGGVHLCLLTDLVLIKIQSSVLWAIEKGGGCFLLFFVNYSPDVMI